MRRPDPTTHCWEPSASLVGLLVLLALFAGALLVASYPQSALRVGVATVGVVAVAALVPRPRFGPPDSR